MTVIPLGLDKAYRPAKLDRIQEVKSKFGISGDYVLYVGNFRPHKNLETLIRAFAGVKQELQTISLVLAGPRDEDFKRLRYLVDEVGAIVTGVISQEDQIALYSGASVFATASLYEGFGYPALEAMACGAPVVSSNAGSLPEILGEAALFVDGSNTTDIAATILKVLTCPSLRCNLSEAGRIRAAQFSHQRYASRLHKLLLKVGNFSHNPNDKRQ